MLQTRFVTRYWLGLLALVSVTTASELVQAQGSSAAPSAASESAPLSDVERLNEEGSRLFQAGDYRRASERFIEAFGISHDPNLMFNIARCYEELGETGLALEKYQAFLAAKDIDEAGAARARVAVERLKQARAQARSASSANDARTAPSAGEANPVAPAAPQAPGGTEPAAGSQSVTGSNLANASVGSEYAGASGGVSPVFPWLALGLGIASAGAGAALYTLGASDHDKVTSARGFEDPKIVSEMTEREAQDLVDSGKSKKTLGVIGLGVGGTLMAVSIGLFLFTGNPEARPAPVARLERARGHAAPEIHRQAVKMTLASGTSGATVSFQGAF